MNPHFLRLDEVFDIQREQIDRYGGSHGVRDLGLLRSALAQPEAAFGGEWLHPDVVAMSAAYAFHLVMNHPFIDGNKRVGTACCYLFLELNGLRLEADPIAFADLILALADGKKSKEEMTAFLRAHAVPD